MQGWNTKRIRRAIVMASDAHGDQKRKEKGISYLSHLWGVTMKLALSHNLAFAKHPEDVVIGGGLHDTLEDTNLVAEEIANEFGPNVLRIVKACTEPDKSLSWETRKKHTIENLKYQDIDVKLVVCSDKLDNLQSIFDALQKEGLNEGWEFRDATTWTYFSRGYKKQKWYYQEILKSLFANLPYNQLPPIFGTFMRLVEFVFDEKVITDEKAREAVPRT